MGDKAGNVASDFTVKGVICQAKEFRLHPETKKEPWGFLHCRSCTITCLFWEALRQQPEGEGAEAEAGQLGASPTAQASDDEGGTKAKVTALARGQTQETFNRSLALA